MDERVFKPVKEASYLTAGNAWRYRAILRFFYQRYERMQHFLLPEEVFRHLKRFPHFRDYTEEQLQQDLSQLVEWNNLVPRQDTGRIQTIEEFKKRKFRYQLTPYTVELERMVMALEKMGDGYGGSLERTLFDRLLQSLLTLTERDDEGEHRVFHWSDERIYRLWQDVANDFHELTRNAMDYIAHLQSEKVEERMKEEAFFAFKEVVIRYLRDFMISLQRTSYRIEGLLEETDADFVRRLAERLADYELSIPRLEERPVREELVERRIGEWEDLKRWFFGDGGQEAELVYLQNATNETIRKITRFAQRLGETVHHMRSRRADYLHLAKWFTSLETLDEAHKLSACVFGVFRTRHLKVEEPKGTESLDVEVWEAPPAPVILKPRITAYRERVKPNAADDHTARKRAVRETYLRRKEEEQRLLAELIRQDRIVLRELPPVKPVVRKTLLSWIAKSMAHPERIGKTETGRPFRLEVASNRIIRLRAEDGVLEMPDIVFHFD
jgi:uncharacterized protein (TIGR02677 family)